ncbi:MAG TPA: ATP-binding protein [Anaerolineae bacterium]|nr:ATP-binding protein [Anaerolineae bacterium]HQI84334.1 ATP-binding protein [Anaerolineae bacterium]
MEKFKVHAKFWLRKSLRLKILTMAVLPVIIVQIAVGALTLLTYGRVTTKLLVERDRELARLMANQLGAMLTGGGHADAFLGDKLIIAQAESSETPGAGAGAMIGAPDGVLRAFLDSSGVVISTIPERAELVGQDWSNRDYVATAFESEEPFISDIISGSEMETEFIASVTPVTEDDELLGMTVELIPWIAGAPNRYSESIVQLLQVGSSASVYVVDSHGRVVYHTNPDYIGKDFSAELVVKLVLSGEANAVRVENIVGRETISSFAAIPNTNWGLILEDDWRTLTREMRTFQPLLIVLLLAGVVAPAMMIAKGIKHVTLPIEELTEATQEVAAGDFNQTIKVATGDEIEALATQFNLMSARLRESYAHLEQRVAERTAELAAAKETAEEARRAAEEARSAAEAANRAKSIFLANMSHELRTPLNAILGYSQLMARDSHTTSAQRDYLDTIGRSGEHLLGLINDVLTMSKIEAGRTSLQENAFDLHRQLVGLKEMFAMRAADKNLSLILDIAPDVPRYIYADEGKLRQVLMNLLSNAVKFTEEGGVTLRVQSRKSKVEGQTAPTADFGLVTLDFEVEDTGLGIAPEEMRAVFDPFVQTSSGQKSQEGTGLGLPISRQFVTMMRGELSVHSVVGEGSIFRVEVPVKLADADAVEIQAEQTRRRVVGLAPGQRAPDGGAYRLLIVEDQPANRDVLVKLLEPFGFEVLCAVNGEEGVAVWERWQPHLVWMDMRMPVMDGYTATRKIKALAQALGRPALVVALTASAFEEDHDAIIAAGCDDFIRKPFRESEIFDILAKHLGVRFIYEMPEDGAHAGQTATGAVDDATTLDGLRAALATLPAAWVADLRQATITLDAARLLALAADIRPQAPRLADTLSQWVHNFDYEKIIQLTAS